MCLRATSCATFHVGSSPYHWARTPEQARDRRSMASLHKHCMPTGVTRHLPLGRRHTAAAHTRAGAPPSAIGRSPAARREPPWRPCRGSCRPRRLGEAASRRSWPIKTPWVVSLRASVSNPSAAVAISAGVVSLPFRSVSGPTEPLVPFPNLHQSLHDHLWLSSPSLFAGNLAATETPRLPCRRPSPGCSPAKSPTPIEP
jgi:hypothetical protein